MFDARYIAAPKATQYPSSLLNVSHPRPRRLGAIVCGTKHYTRQNPNTPQQVLFGNLVALSQASIITLTLSFRLIQAPQKLDAIPQSASRIVSMVRDIGSALFKCLI